MAGGKIGGILISLGLDSAQFTVGLKKADADISSFGKKAAIGFAAVAAAAVAASSALGIAVKSAINHADEMSKAAQKAGTTTEALSRLAYAASFSDVSLEGLTSGLGKLSKAMADSLVTPTSTAALAFKALGVNVKDAAGNLRPSGDVLAEISDKFSRLEDGSTKTALAMQIFGKSGAELIPLLNGGAAEMKRLGDESDRTGNTISTKTGKAAEEFNDSLTRLGKVFDGIILKITEGMLPSLDGLSKWLNTLDPQTLAVAAGITGLATAAAIASPAIGALAASMKLLYAQLALIAALPAGVIGLATGAYFASTSPVGAGEDALIKRLGLTKLPAIPADDVGAGPGSFGDLQTLLNPTVVKLPQLPGSSAGDPKKNALVDGLKATGAALDDVQQKAQRFADTAASAFSNFADAVLSGTNPLQAMSDLLGDIGKQLLNAGIQTLFRSLFAGAGGGSLFSLPGFAAGTMSAPAGLAWVGENGPELVNFRGGESVLSAPQSAALAGGPQINISITGSRQDAAEIARQVGRTLPDAIAAYNRNPRRRT